MTQPEPHEMGRENHLQDGADVLRTSGGSRRNPASKGSRVEPILIYQTVSRRPFPRSSLPIYAAWLRPRRCWDRFGQGKMRRKCSTTRLSSSIIKTLSGAPRRETALVDELGQRARPVSMIASRPSAARARSRSGCPRPRRESDPRRARARSSPRAPGSPRIEHRAQGED
jgi:hypothetical protein